MDTFDGIPTHPLFVHLTVVAIPLAALLGIVAVAWPAARRKIGIVGPAVALVALIMTPITTSAGEALEEKTPSSSILNEHTEWGDRVLYLVAPLFLFMLIFWALNSDKALGWLTSKVSALNPRTVSIANIVVAVLVVGFALASLVLIYQVGHSGAESVWRRD
ncbi:DUF2231 domain-containing protein [Williamsia sp. CHRR-6]|uniref:DUF2231 domain-containing protein n=1 Tax=Williamsia sp. CHRR-6 TaxID=2835871 RepID=UPI001BDB15DA|nr:DUF2231 domain-containing protein [Williamsia sp. CHRR-6]MBT0567353.1 hypothetical protein [Williamsia sp. CHRR-6]